ncbi:MAG TPA: DUF2142 domain-containing protein [Sphingomicrobium sp.]|nr:DUF2142 domain-containing protein [Sphingomicrobium sp.]
MAERGRLRRILRAPEAVFLFFSLIAGLVLVGLITPLVGGNETYNFQRASSIANGELLVRPVALPGGTAELLEAIGRRFPLGTPPPYVLSESEYQTLAAIPLRADEPRVVTPSPITVLHPISYLPHAPTMAAGQALGLSPLAIFYIGRLAGLLAGIALTVFAIRIVPVHKHALAAIALLPPMLFSRSTLDADQLTNGLAFLFLAMVIREIVERGPLPATRIAAIAITGFFLAQAKSAYLLLPLLTLAIPAERFGTPARKAWFCALFVLPGVAGSVGWMLLVKHTFFNDIQYGTWSGIVQPDRQLAAILANPFLYAVTLLRTLFATMLIPTAVIELFGVFGPPVKMPALMIAAVAGLFAATILSQHRAAEPRLSALGTKALAAGISAVTLVIILTLLYLQWTRFGAPVIQGFNGRYIYPLAPLLLLLVAVPGRRIFGVSASAWLIAMGVVSVAGTWLVTSWTYLA